jgi:hypothetical protein
MHPTTLRTRPGRASALQWRFWGSLTRRQGVLSSQATGEFILHPSGRRIKVIVLAAGLYRCGGYNQYASLSVQTSNLQGPTILAYYRSARCGQPLVEERANET